MRVFIQARPCDATGQLLEDGAPPTPPPSRLPDDWTPYRDRVEFEAAEFLYTRTQMSTGDINVLLDLWAATLLKHNDKPPFVDCCDLHKIIDSTPVGDVKWQSFQPAHDVPPWMDQSHDVWYRDPHEVIRNMLANPDYATEMDYQPYLEFSTDDNTRQWQDFMSGDWAWNQADIISKDPGTTGSTFVPVILGSDKTTVSVATGANDYYPLYISIGNVHNNVRRAHCDAVAIIGFLAMPKTTKEHASCPTYQKYCRQLFHLSISKILENLRPGRTKPEVVRFGDGHYRCVIYGLGPYIADYKEQVLLACIVRSWCPRCMSHCKNLDAKSLHCTHDHTEALIEEVSSTDLWDKYGIIHDLIISHMSCSTTPFTNDFPRADINQLIAPDILHQLIKGSFKDHLVEWVGKYLLHVHGKKGAEKIQDEIDRRIAVVASFSGLRHFPEGRGFKQLTTIQVYLPAIEGHVPMDVVRTFRAFLEFCYLVWRNIITESTLVQIQDALDRFHHYRKVFESIGVVPTFSLPRQHSCSHYILLIRLFGAPNGLCSSITETKHIKAVKEPWRCSSRYKALGQMLVTNQRLNKLAASRIDFKSNGMLNGTCLSETLWALKCQHAQTIPALSAELAIPHLHLYNILRQFLFEQVNPNDQRSPSEVPLASCLRFDGKIQVFNSASSIFYEAPQYDCVFVNTDAGVEGMGGMDIAHVMKFSYPCTVVRWFDKADDGPDEDTGMWIVKPSYDDGHSPSTAIIHVDSIYQAAHLIQSMECMPSHGTLKHYDSYDAF
ncbi:uncharacterized protein F5147DRAFT_749411 [Suillus discolor]|uniref:C2H2-type domain-containing protein n=1 Tax=Suillus discolor TaxID=1912936 RepID=A0A9P7JKX1_9AGAM|nr:uncharacterized protein F5147DRAFT_749411 [Suillus discolor]KAG2080026.1 hypothetical protein F5147DRAFT_749411 [Suillus discolor]